MAIGLALRLITPAAAETLDRVVASVGRVAITASDVSTEYRLEYLLEHARLPVDRPDPATWRAVRDRLIEQELLAYELAAEGSQPAEVTAATNQELAAFKKKFASQEAFDAALDRLGLDEPQVLVRLVRQEQTLRFIDERLRPAASVDQNEIESYYRQTFLPAYAQKGQGAAPRLEDVEDQIREILIQQKMDRLLPDWLEKLPAGLRVKVFRSSDSDEPAD